MHSRDFLARMLQIDHLGFRYRDDAPWAVDDVSLSLGRGEVFGLLGPNGAGKSTLMALISGLLPPGRGTIRRDRSLTARGGFALVPQEYAFYPMLTCRENLEFFAGALGFAATLGRTRIAAALATTGLDASADKLARECSGGLKRRLNLAIGLVGDPQLLLLDEPTTGVDPQSRAFLLQTVRALRDGGKTVIYTSHYMEEVQQVGDRVAILDHGRLLCCGTLTELLAGAPTRLLVRLAQPLDATTRQQLVATCGLEPGASTQPGNWLPFTVPPGTAADEVLAELRRRRLELVGFQYGSRHLEDLFLQLTHHSLRD